MTDRMSGKFCVVTGAARGIGKAIAQAFIEEGATVLLTDCDEQTLGAAGEELDCET
ncbi:SDR family NAD(P)-dependent oxidoreductase, partial [Parasphingorhabdus sp.]|uniref:SDR family NAD(P)-dependent oxidoreductase n=1 Tax=Parasphingorhabdus sp. TaxID=2709688 RepID=UPI0030031F45